MKYGLMNVEKSEKSVEIPIWLNPKLEITMGVWLPSSEQEKVKRLSLKCEYISSLYNGYGNGLLLTDNAEDEEIVWSYMKI